MARRGRKPKPRGIRELEGNRGRRPLPDEPDFPVGTTFPRWMTPGAKTEWRRIYAELERAGVVTRLDRAALAAYCVWYDRWVCAEKAVRKFFERHGTYAVRTKSGTVKAIPDLAVAKTANEEMRRWATEIGLTPSARTRVSPVDLAQREQDPLADFLGGSLAPSRPESEEQLN